MLHKLPSHLEARQAEQTQSVMKHLRNKTASFNCIDRPGMSMISQEISHRKSSNNPAEEERRKFKVLALSGRAFSDAQSDDR